MFYRWLGDSFWGNSRASMAWIRSPRCSLHGQVQGRAGGCQESEGRVWNRHQAFEKIEPPKYCFVQVSLLWQLHCNTKTFFTGEYVSNLQFFALWWSFVLMEHCSTCSGMERMYLPRNSLSGPSKLQLEWTTFINIKWFIETSKVQSKMKSFVANKLTFIFQHIVTGRSELSFLSIDITQMYFEFYLETFGSTSTRFKIQ